MQSLGNLNSVSGNSVTFSAVENVAVPEGPFDYVARVPTWEVVRKFGNVAGNGYSITQNFTFTGNIIGNATLAVDTVGNVTYSIVGNSVAINNIRSVQDYLGSRIRVAIANDVSGNFSHLGNVINTNTGNSFQFEIFVNVVEAPEFNTANLANIAYDFFGANVTVLSNVITDISNSAPRVVTAGQPAGNATVTITSQDASAFISLNTTSTAAITKTFSTVGGNGVLTLVGTRPNINSHLSTLTMTKNNANITRLVRQISYECSGPAGINLQTVTGNYFANFEDPIHVAQDVNYYKEGMPGVLYGAQANGTSTRPHKITYAGQHPATGEPHFAYPFVTDAGNVAVKIYGLRTSSAAVVPGPLFDLGVANTSTPQVTSSIVSGNAYTQANTQILMGTSVAGQTGNLGCDAGDYTAVSHTPLVSFNAVTPDYSTVYSLTRPNLQPLLNYSCSANTFQGSSLIAGNVIGEGTSYWIQRKQIPTPSEALANTRSVMDYYSQDLYNAFPGGWNIPHHESSAYADYYVTWNQARTTSYQPGNVAIPDFGFDLKKLNFAQSRVTSTFYPSGALTNADQNANVQILFRPDGQRGQLFHVDLDPTGATTPGKSITMWRGSSDLNSNPVQELVHLQTVAHGGSVANSATSLTRLNTGNIGPEYNDRNLVSSTPSPAPAGTTHTFTATVAGNLIAAVAVANTVSVISGTSLANNNPPLWLQRGLTYTFVNGSSAPFNLGSISVPANVIASSTSYANGSITFSVSNTAPNFSSYSVSNKATNAYGGAGLNIYTGNTVSSRWSTVIPGAVSLVRGNATTAYMFYTKYTGAPTAALGLNSSAGLYYRSLTVDSSYNITWGTPVVVQDPAQTGNIYGASMAAASTTIDNVTYVFCAISPNSNPVLANSHPTMVGIKIT
jgi:hypothetical protein